MGLGAQVSGSDHTQ